MGVEQSSDNTSQKNIEKPLTIMQRRWRKFKSLKRGYYSFIILISAYIFSFFFPIFINSNALIVHYNDEYYFPAVKSFFVDLPVVGGIFGSDFYSGEKFGQVGNTGNCRFRDLDEQFEAENGANWVIMPLYPYDPLEDISVEGNEHLVGPFDSKNGSEPRLFGTDDRGRDVFARMAYGFNVSISFALLLAVIEYIIGITFGSMLGYFGGKFDIIMQRFIEIMSALPIFFIVIIVVSIVKPSFLLLVGILALVSWIGVSTMMRAEFYREKAKDYVVAAISIGVPTHKIMIKHILPNSLVPIITYFPFAIVAGISALVSLDFLGFGLAPPEPSWGQMMGVGLPLIATGQWWLIVAPMTAIFFTLLLTVFIGEGVREAFDPKVFSRLR